MSIITIDRQYGAHGDEIGKRVAEALGLRFLDRDIVRDVADRLGVPEQAVDERDERGGTLVSQMLRQMGMFYPVSPSRSGQGGVPEVDQSAYIDALRQVIREYAHAGGAVIVGRGATWLLDHDADTLHVLIIAPLEHRLQRVMETDHLSRSQAMQKIKSIDTGRSRYVRHFYGSDWMEVQNYDLVLNTGHFTEDQAVEVIRQAAPTAATSAR